jgi:hypothetical protein
MPGWEERLHIGASVLRSCANDFIRYPQRVGQMSPERRRGSRRSVRQPAIIIKFDGVIVGKCVMADVSATGAKLLSKVSSAIPHEFLLILSRDGGLRRQCLVVWRSETAIGVRFTSKQRPGGSPNNV